MTGKYFIAVLPPADLLNRIRQIKDDFYTQYGTKGALRSPAHITLHMPFEFEEEKEQRLIDALHELPPQEPFAIDLRHYGCFEPRVIYISVNESQSLRKLQEHTVRLLKTRLHLYNQADSMRGFHPHITVAFRDLKKNLFYKAWETYKDQAFEASFTCGSIWLMKQQDQHWQAYREFSF